MKSTYDSPLAKKHVYFHKNKLTALSFHKYKLLNSKLNSSMTNLKTYNCQKNNFTDNINKNKELKIKRIRIPIEYYSEYLYSDLMTFRSEVQKRKNELIRLKIKYIKYLNDNNNNKALLANILGISMNQLLKKGELIYKLNKCKLKKEERQSLQHAYKILNLKLELNSKKKLLSDNVMYLKMLIENSKMRVISHLQSEYFIKCEQQRSLIKILKKLQKKYNEYEANIFEMKIKLNMQNIRCENLFGMEYQDIDCINQMLDEKNTLVNQINRLKDKIKIHKRNNIHKEREMIEKERNNTYDEQKLNLIRECQYEGKEEKDAISQISKSNIEIEAIIKKQSIEIKSLKEELEKYRQILYNYNEEKPKLIFKAKESKKNIDKIESLIKELNIIQKQKEEKENIYNKNIEEFNEIKNKSNKYNKKYNKKIKENMNIKKDLKKKLLDLNRQLNKFTNKNNILKSKIIQAQNNYNQLNQNKIDLKTEIEKNNIMNLNNIKIYKEDRLKERKQKEKERKLIIDKLKQEQGKLINKNQIIENENGVLIDEIDGYDRDLINYEKIEKQLKNSIQKIQTNIYNELLQE